MPSWAVICWCEAGSAVAGGCQVLCAVPRLSVAGLHLWLATVISSTSPTSFLLFLPRTKLTLLLRAAAAAGAGMRKPIIQNVDNKAITLLFLVTLRPSRASLQYRKQFVIKQIYCILQQAYKSRLKHVSRRWEKDGKERHWYLQTPDSHTMYPSVLFNCDCNERVEPVLGAA